MAVSNFQIRQAALQLAINANGQGKPDVLQLAREFALFLGCDDIVLDHDVTPETVGDMVVFLKDLADDADLLPPDGGTIDNVIDLHSYTKGMQPSV